MIIYRLNTISVLFLICSVTAFSQTKKLEQSYSAKNDVKLNIDARHTNLIVETWDKNEVHIEAFLDAPKLNSTEAEKLLNNWKLETSGNTGEITISSGGGVAPHSDMDIASLNQSMGHLQNLIAPIMSEMVAPMLENMAKNPPLPPDFTSKMGNLNFDYEAYQKDGEKYMKRWEKEVEKNFGKDFEESMEKWAAQFEKNAEIWGENMEKEMEIKGEEFEKSMEAWGESFGAEMEKWGEQFAREMEGREAEETFEDNPVKSSTKFIRNIKIKVPENARLNLDVRHGEVKLGNRTNNLKANLSHSKLTGNIIEGEKTDVKAAYTSINILQWNYGILNTSYVQNCTINKVKSIKLVSNSSDVEIKEISETGILSGTFGMLKIGKLNPGFKNLDITLKNSDLRLNIPQTALNFNYNGTQSVIDYPKATTIRATNSYDTQILNGFYQSGSANKNISINATFSDIVIK